jgi:hypothetical protein
MKIRKTLSSDIKDFFKFTINNDYIEWHGEQIYFLRIQPKNMTILSYSEKLDEIKKFQSFIDAAASKFSIFITDKTEDLSEISDYYKKQLALRPDYQFVIQPVINKISDIEETSACVQRAFYIVFKAHDRREFEIFSKQLSDNISCKTAEKEELILVMRNFILREYTPFNLYVFENCLKEHYEQFQKAKKKNQRAPENPYREQREDNISAIDRLIPNESDNNRDNKEEVKKNAKSKEDTDGSEHLWGRS